MAYRAIPCTGNCTHIDCPEMCRVALLESDQVISLPDCHCTWVWRFTYLLKEHKNPYRCKIGLSNLPDHITSFAEIDQSATSMYANALKLLPTTNDPGKCLLQIMTMLKHTGKCLTRLLRPTDILHAFEQLKPNNKRLSSNARARFLSFLLQEDPDLPMKIFSDRCFGLFRHSKDASTLLQFGVDIDKEDATSFYNFTSRFYEELKSPNIKLTDFIKQVFSTSKGFQVLLIMYFFVSFEAVEYLESHALDTLGETSEEYTNVLKLVWRSQCIPYITKREMSEAFPCMNKNLLDEACQWYYETVLKECKLDRPQPRSLAQHCRVTIRHNINCKGSSLPQAIKTLGLPHKMNKYLNLEAEIKTRVSTLNQEPV